MQGREREGEKEDQSLGQEKRPQTSLTEKGDREDSEEGSVESKKGIAKVKGGTGSLSRVRQ